MIKALLTISYLLLFLMIFINIKRDLEEIRTQQYIQTLTLRQILGCYND